MTEPHSESSDSNDASGLSELMDQLQQIDPVLSDPSPAVGSNRFTSIKDTAMNMSTEQRQDISSAEREGAPVRGLSKRSQLLLGAAAVLAALAVVTALVIPGSTSGAAADVRTAVANTAAVTDFRIRMVAEDVAVIPGGQANGEVDGENMHLVAGDLEFYRIGDQEWVGENGQFESTPASDTFLPFGQASEAVLTAALSSDDVSTIGQETLNGVATTHHVINIDDDARAALSDVSVEAQIWFVGNVSEEIVEDGSPAEPRRFGFLEDADSIDVWVADGLIHQIAVDSTASDFTFTFYDFNADIAITPPQ